MALILAVVVARVLDLVVVLASQSPEYKAKGRRADAGVPAEDLSWAGRAKSAVVVAGAAAVGMVVDSEVEVVGTCERTKARDDANSEAADGPIQQDSKTEAVLSE